MPLTSYNTTTSPSRIILGPSILRVGGVPHSVSRGTRAEFTDEYTQPEFDGVPFKMAGLDYRASVGVRITGTFFERGAAQIAREQGNTTGVLAGGVTTYTPRTPGAYWPAGSAYQDDVEVVMEDGGGSIHRIVIPKALITSRTFDGVDGTSLTIEARSTDPDVVPYTHTITAVEPVLSSIVIAPATVELDAI